MTPAQLLKAAERELARRARLNAAGETAKWSLEAFCGGHAEQLAFCRDASNWIHLLCDRQSGKTQGCLGALNDNALTRPRSLNVFLGLVGTGLEISVWPKWKSLLDLYGVKRSNNETLRVSYYPNGSMVVFGGTDDLSNIKKYLGNRLDGGLFIVDESQDQKSSLLRYLVDQLLPPMCTPTTRVVLAGVLPDLPVGAFLDLATYDEASKTGGKGKRFSHHSWGRLANVHTPEAAAMLAQLEADSPNNPQLLRDWCGVQRVWDASLTAYRYVATRDSWTGVPISSLTPEMLQPGRLLAVAPPEGIDCFAIGLDPAATADRFAIVLWGWSSTRRMGLWQLAEWVTARGANALESQYLAVVVALKRAYEHWGPILRVIRDAGSSRTINDVLLRNHHLLIEPAIKGPGSLRARVDRLADVLGTGQGHILAGSELENDLKLAKWSLKAREESRWEFDATHHPDVADAATYGAVAFYESAAPTLTGEEAERQAYLDQVRRAEEEQRRQQSERTGQDAAEFAQDFDDLSL